MNFFPFSSDSLLVSEYLIASNHSSQECGYSLLDNSNFFRCSLYHSTVACISDFKEKVSEIKEISGLVE